MTEQTPEPDAEEPTATDTPEDDAPESATPRPDWTPQPLPAAPPVELDGEGGASAGDDRLKPPLPVLISFWIWIVDAVVLVLSGVLEVFHRNDIIAEIRQAKPAGVTDYASYANQILITTVIVSVVFAAIYTLFAFRVREGRNWARMVVTVITALDVVYDLMDAGSVSLYTLVSALIAVAAVILLYVPSSAAYFTAVRAARTAALPK